MAGSKRKGRNRMDRQWILLHLREGLEELNRTITAFETQAAYGEIEFEIAMAHLYNHLNTAWNSRNAAPERIAKCSESDFYKWRAFPQDISMAKP